jgi:hypothetical protein
MLRRAKIQYGDQGATGVPSLDLPARSLLRYRHYSMLKKRFSSMDRAKIMHISGGGIHLY